MQKLYMTIGEAAEALGFTEERVYRLIAKRQVGWGRKLAAQVHRVYAPEFDAWIKDGGPSKLFPPEEWITAEEVAEALSCPVTRVHKLVRGGQLECERYGHRHYFDPDKALEFAARGYELTNGTDAAEEEAEQPTLVGVGA